MATQLRRRGRKYRNDEGNLSAHSEAFAKQAPNGFQMYVFDEFILVTKPRTELSYDGRSITDSALKDRARIIKLWVQFLRDGKIKRNPYDNG